MLNNPPRPSSISRAYPKIGKSESVTFPQLIYMAVCDFRFSSLTGSLGAGGLLPTPAINSRLSIESP